MSVTPVYRVGECEVFKIPELDASLSTQWLFPAQALASGTPETITLSVHSWVVRTPDNLIVIDTGSGNGRERAGSPLSHQLNTPYAQRLRDAGVDPDAVDIVLITHLHGDHVGWNTHWMDGKWTPFFKHARYYCSDSGLKGWQHDPARKTLLEDSINPVIAAGLLETFDVTQEPVFADVLRYVPTPGHSHDHASIILHSAGDYALFSGDLMHNDLQVSQPQLASRFCADAAQAEAQRRWAMTWASEHQARWFSSHFPGSSAGYVSQTSAEFEWQFI
ncbi:MBL fold metallo-hydrolase [Pantoea stewartii]|uniref:MBL fold metallo-hydrolase n=1 Tax=Pantoea stewartii TaxID=66269 RepID=UPI001562778E|nr:MBL fold metallo-hydrolase [Pantoea stewartii]NRH22480.1 MBL fold metallo-hydrolase [Pantoea stewartii]